MAKTTNIDKVIRDFKKTSAAIRKAEVFALNRAGRDTHPEAKRQLKRDYRIKMRKVNQAKQSPKRATKNKERYILTYRDARINVKDYGLRQTKKAATWSVKRGKRIQLLHGFKVGHNSPNPAAKIDGFGMIRTGVFKVRNRREIIKSVTGPSVPQLLKAKGIDKRLNTFFKKKYTRVLAKRIKQNIPFIFVTPDTFHVPIS